MTGRAEVVRTLRLLAAGVVCLTGAACAAESVVPPLEPVDPEAHRVRVEEWRAWRHDQLTRPDGWLSLAGLYWLEIGDNVIGTAADADLPVSRPDAPAMLGTFAVSDDRVEFTPAPDTEVLAAGGPFAGGTVWSADEGFEPVELSHGTLTWFVIVRDGRLGVRLRDSDNPVLTEFAGMGYYPLEPRWRIDGRFEPYDPPRTIRIPNVLGTVGEEPSEGAAVFEVDGEEHRVDLWRDSDDPANFFTAFGDASNGEGTYGGGRFLWIDAPDEYGRLEIDFNRSYNPPCVFTPFATCPLPPPQNRLTLRIEAGEREFLPATR